MTQNMQSTKKQLVEERILLAKQRNISSFRKSLNKIPLGNNTEISNARENLSRLNHSINSKSKIHSIFHELENNKEIDEKVNNYFSMQNQVILVF